MNQLCISFSLSDKELIALDDIIKRTKPSHKGDNLFQDGDKMESLYAIRSGEFKTFVVDEHGEEQITGFHFAGDVIGFEAIEMGQYSSFAQALETSMVCELPYNQLDSISNILPNIKKQVLRMMSKEIRSEHTMLSLLNQKSADQRLATFLVTLSSKYHLRGFSATEFKLSMTRKDIGNYIGLSVETISRIINRFKKKNIIAINGKFISIINEKELKKLALM